MLLTAQGSLKHDSAGSALGALLTQVGQARIHGRVQEGVSRLVACAGQQADRVEI